MDEIDAPMPARCRQGSCARLCTDHGLAAADAAHRATLLNRARRIVVDPDLAEEAVQEALVRAWRSCSTFDATQGPLLNWLVTITRNVSIDLVKARTRRPPVASGAPSDARDQSGDGLSDVDRLLLRDELTRALTSIGPDHRAAVLETVVRDRAYADVAAELGVPAATLRTRVFYALRRLREHLDNADLDSAHSKPQTGGGVMVPRPRTAVGCGGVC